jgi:2'-5' RNA ligase
MRDHFGCRVALKSAAHITLIPPFWFDYTSESLLTATLQSFQTDKIPLDIQLYDFFHFSNRVIFITVNENHRLGGLRKETEDHFIQPFPGIIKPDDRAFHPHVTIANRDIKPGDFIRAWEHFSREKLEENFCATTISLLKLSLEKWNVLAEKQY